MKSICIPALLLTASVAFGHQHGLKPADAMKQLAFLTGHWVGKQTFETGAEPMIGSVINDIDFAVGGRYLAERLSTTLNGRNPTDTRHFLTFDGRVNAFKAWWFTDTSVAPWNSTSL